MHNVSALLGILIRQLRVKTTALAVGLQILFRSFLLVRGKDGTLLLKKSKSDIETNWNVDFIKTTSDLSEINKQQNLMVFKCWLPPWVQWSPQGEESVLPWRCWAVAVQIFDPVLLPSSPFEERCGKHITVQLEGFSSSEMARNYFSLLHLHMLNWRHKIFLICNRFMFDLLLMPFPSQYKYLAKSHWTERR